VISRLFSRTVWGHGRLEQIPDRYRPLVRWVYPLIYFLNVALFGVFGTITGGTQTMRNAYPYPGASLFCLVIGLSGLIALVGVVFQQQQLERTGDGLLVATTSTYLFLLIAALADGTPSQPLATIVTTTAFCLLAFFRIRDLSREIGEKRKKETRT
jgi:hypothetical protein